MLDQILNAANAKRSDGSAASAFSLDQLLTGSGGLATGAAAGGLAALLLGGARPKKLARNALKVGGVALVGGLAYKAWRDWQANNAPSSSNDASQPLGAPVGSPFLPESDDERGNLARALTRAMITAAKADGHVTGEEKERILSQLDSLQIDAADRALIAQELEGPSTIDAVVQDATTPELAAELYAASLLAIDPEGDAERAYLSLLAARLKLDKGLVAHLHANAGAAANDADFAAERGNRRP